MTNRVRLEPAACYAAGMDRFAEMIGLMDELYGHPDTWPRKEPRNPHKLRANVLANQAINRGELVPEPCEDCGIGGSWPHGRRLVQAHHHDYSKPLDVHWLCERCHAKRHLAISFAKAANRNE